MIDDTLRRLASAAATALVLAAAAPSAAAPYYLVSNGPGGGGPTEIFVSENHWRAVRVQYNGVVSLKAAGLFDTDALETLSIGTPIGLPAQDLPTFCLEIGQAIALPTLYEAVPVATQMSAARADALARLWGARFSTVLDPLDPQYDGVVGAAPRDRAGAMQAAIWEIAIDGNNGLAAGAFRLVSPDAPLLALTQAYLAIAYDPTRPLAEIRALVSPTGQDLLDAPDGVVPAPATVLLLAPGLLALAFRRRLAARGQEG